ncbi:glycosyltransferase family 4 protein [Candidatus Daviesbacteria bacterium]|nr:glycosyltransferase family 4 protein [Candidatus Daviesbacteria bacterium]
MKIAILSFYSGQVDRGVETWAKNLKEKLKDFDIEIISGKAEETYFTNVLRNIKRWAKTDIVVPTNGRSQVFVCRLVSWITRRPMVVFGHSGPGADDKWNLLCSPNIFVAFSDSQKKWAESHRLPWTKVVKIPHAVDTKIFTPPLKKPRKKIVLCVAANSPDKRVDLVRSAAEMIGYKFVGVGKGSDKQVTHQKMPEVYKEADVFCFVPQPWEAFGLVFLEAMASNLPIVTIDDPVRREIVGDAGIFVKDPTVGEELSYAIFDAYDKSWGDKPRKQAEKFSWDKVVKKYEDLFATLQGASFKGHRVLENYKVLF